MKKVVGALLITLFLLGCDDLFNPALQNNRGREILLAEPIFAEGLLGQAYSFNPLNSWTFNDVATDDAVSNDPGNFWRRIATGEWSPLFNSQFNNNWQDRRGVVVKYINFFIDIAPDVAWANDPVTHGLFRNRMIGEAHGMRALHHFHLLRTTAGWTDDGQLLAFPLVLEPQGVDSDFDVPRNTFREVVEQIRDDVAIARHYLPMHFGEITAAELPRIPIYVYTEDGRRIREYATLPQYNRVFGERARNRLDGSIAEAILAQTLLLAASPAFSEGTGITYAEAAEQFAVVLRLLGSNPVAEIDPQGHFWFDNRPMLNTLGAGVNPREVIWRGNRGTTGTGTGTGVFTRNQFPPGPGTFGRGRVNPTRNLVDAFPMLNGFPIDHPESGFNPQNPYAGRDPRLSRYIVYNGSRIGGGNTLIETREDGPNNNALNRIAYSTRTGYYMRKLLRGDVTLTAGAGTGQFYFQPFIRYTEMFLGFAEAANEAFGPTDATFGFSAYDVVRAIRARAGVGADNNDAFLASIRNDQAAMRELIRNERRLELAFEGHRFWDLRRWNLPLNEPAKGTRIRYVDGVLTHEVFEVEERAFLPHMRHAPIPNSEILKFNALRQNRGW